MTFSGLIFLDPLIENVSIRSVIPKEPSWSLWEANCYKEIFFSKQINVFATFQVRYFSLMKMHSLETKKVPAE